MSELKKSVKLSGLMSQNLKMVKDLNVKSNMRQSAQHDTEQENCQPQQHPAREVLKTYLNMTPMSQNPLVAVSRRKGSAKLFLPWAAVSSRREIIRSQKLKQEFLRNILENKISHL